MVRQLSNEDTIEITIQWRDLDETSVSSVIADGIANLEDIQPTDLNPLFYAIDTEALDQLIQNADLEARSRIQLTFDYKDYRIEIDAQDDIQIAISLN